jgi:hemerythrin-like domain-containing protein
MMPIGPLMIEHRLIERMIALMSDRLKHLRRENQTDPLFIDKAVHFMRVYADECHHGKEEDILFKQLQNKSLTQEHRRTITELMEEHAWGRKTTGRLVKANEDYRNGNPEALKTIETLLDDLVTFYPQHIQKEDKGFFIPVMHYFTDAEKDAMLKDGQVFDSDLFHKEFDRMVSSLEGVENSDK